MNELNQQEELFFRADELVKRAEEHIANFAGESLFYYEENDSDDDTGAYINARSMPKSDEYAQHVEQITEVVIIDSRFLGYYNNNNLSAIFVQAELSFRQKDHEENDEWIEWDEVKNYILCFEGHDSFSPYEVSEKDIDGWSVEFEWLEIELNKNQSTALSSPDIKNITEE